MSPRELKICILLCQSQNGLFAAQLHQASPALLKRGSVYTTLARLVAKGWISTNLGTDATKQAPRPRYDLSADGAYALTNFMKLMGLEFVHSAEATPMTSAKLKEISK